MSVVILPLPSSLIIFTSLDPLGNSYSSLVVVCAIPFYTFLFVVTVFLDSTPLLMVQTVEVLVVYPFSIVFQLSSLSMSLSRVLLHFFFSIGLKHSYYFGIQNTRFPQKSSKISWALTGAICLLKIKSLQFYLFDSSSRALKASLISINLRSASSLPGLFLGWYLMASLRNDFLIY